MEITRIKEKNSLHTFKDSPPPLVWVGDFMLRKDPKNTEAPHVNI